MGIRVYGEVNRVGLVDNYINTAYDTVKLVSDNIASVSLVSTSITDVSTIASNIASVNLVNLDLVKGKGTNTITDSAILNCLDNATAVANSVASVSTTVDSLNNLYNANDVLAKLLTVDGAGSGLDADLLDGQSSAYYRNFNNLTNRPSTYTPTTLSVQNILGNMVSGNTELGIAVTYNATNKKLDFNVSDPTITLSGDLTGSVTLTNLGSATLLATVKDNSHAHTIANVTGLQASLNSKEPTLTASTIINRLKTVDGSGSGLDADLLDGNNSTYYAKTSDVSVNTSHRTNSSNPHTVTKAQVGLSLVPNHDFTSEVNANTAKVSDINHVNIQLPNVDNTSDINKPVSTAVQNQLNTKLDVLSDVLKTITATAKAVYIYDTSKDIIDWRHNENASWYNEPLNTATRGATREFPAVALIVATDTEFTIYDATNPLLPMWCVFNAQSVWVGAGTYHVNSPTIAEISAENGGICVARGSVVIGVDCFDFVNDSITMFHASMWGGDSGVNIAGRNGTTYYKQNSATGFVGVVGAAKSLLVTHDKHGNTLIYIGSTGGLVRIEGTSSYSNTSVWSDLGNTLSVVGMIGVSGQYLYFSVDGDFGYREMLIQDISMQLIDSRYNASRYTGRLETLFNSNKTRLVFGGLSQILHLRPSFMAIATDSAFFLTLPNPTAYGLGLHATITSSFNSGYQYGDIKGAWLADTVAGTMTGGTVADRSYNNSPLTINGTLTKTPVNTGCELVWFNYSLAQTATTTATGYIEWWEEVAGVPTKYIKNLAGTGDYVNGRAGTVSSSVSITTGTLTINANVNITLLRIGNGFSTIEQIAYAYNQEKHLFNPNTACTLAGTSDDCKAIDYDSNTGLHHVATATNKSVFKGLVRVSSKVGAFTTVSAQNDYVAEA